MKPTVEHEIRGQFLREHGNLATKLLDTLGITVPKWTKCEIGESSTTQAKPVVSAADAVLIYKDAKDKAVFVIAIEIQRSKKHSKITRWPLYATTLADRYGCLAIVLVLASTPSIGRWAKKLNYSYGSVSFEPKILDATTVPPAMPESTLGETIISAWVRARSADADEAIKLAIKKLKCREDFDWLISGFEPKIQRRIEDMMGAQEYRWFDVIVEERATKLADELVAKAEERAVLAEERAVKLVEERAVKLAEERAVKLVEERAVKLAEERAVKLAEERAVKLVEERAVKLVEERAVKLAEERAVKLAEERAVKLVEERAVKLAEERAVKLVEEMTKEIEQQTAQMELSRAEEQLKTKQQAAEVATSLVEALRKIAGLEQTESAALDLEGAQKQLDLALVTVRKAQAYLEQLKEQFVRNL